MSEVMNVLGDECRGDECRTIATVNSLMSKFRSHLLYLLLLPSHRLPLMATSSSLLLLLGSLLLFLLQALLMLHPKLQAASRVTSQPHLQLLLFLFLLHFHPMGHLRCV